MRIGTCVLGLAAIATGVIDLVWGRFDPAHQPIQAWGDVGQLQAFAYAAGVLLVAGGAAILLPWTTRYGGAALAIVYVVFTVFWLPRLYTAPHYLGLSAAVVIGVLAGVFEPLIVAAAAAIIFKGKVSHAARWILGVGAVLFGLNHLMSIHEPDMLIYVPHWLPIDQPFWVGFTGVMFVLAGIAILATIFDALAAWLLGLQFLVFSAVTLIPGLIMLAQRDEGNWGGNAYEFAAVAAYWVFAGYLSGRTDGSARYARAPSVSS